MPAGSTLHTIEINDEMEDDLLKLFETSLTTGTRIVLHTGDCLDILPTLPLEQFELVYIDANKRHYADYLELMLPRLKEGTFIIADNTLWGGKVTDTSNHDPQTVGILAFNDLVARHPRLETVILPLRDGLTLMRVKS